MAIALSGSLILSGSITVSGSIISTGTITMSGSIASASYASNAELLDGLDSSVFTLTSSFNAQTSSFNAFSASILSYTASQNILNSTFATTGSNTFIGNQTITGSIFGSGSLTINGCITSTGQIVAQTINVQQVTSSIVYSCGSNIFGTTISNTQTMTGSVLITGSLNTVGNACITSMCSPTFVGGTISGTTIYASTVACSPVGCFATSCATSFVGGTVSGTTIYGSTAICSANGLLIGNGGVTAACNYLPKFTGTSTIGNSVVFDGTRALGIGTATPVDFGSGTYNVNIYDAGIPLIQFNNASTGLSSSVGMRIQAVSNDFYFINSQATGNQIWLNNGAERMRLDSSGNLMVGSLSAGNAGTINVSVGCAGTTAGGLQLWATSAQTHYVQFGDGTAGAGPYAGYIGYAHATDTLLLGAGAATRAIISSTGIACFACQVCSPQFVGGSITGTYATFGTDVVGDPVYLRVQNYNTGGYPSSLALSIYGYASSPAGYYDQFRIQASYPGFGLTNFIVKEQAQSSEVIALSIRGTGVACFSNTVCVPMLLASGCVGIGTTSPGYKLDVIGDIRTSSEIYIDNGYYLRFKRSSGGLSIQTLGIPSGTDNVQLLTTGDFNILNGSLTNLMTVKNGGNVGIGTTSPQTLLHILSSGEGLYVGRVNGSSPHVRLQGSNGTVGARTISSNGDRVGQLSFEGYNGSNYMEHTGIFGVVNGAVTAGSIPTDLVLTAGSSGGIADNERMRITSGGVACFGGTVCAPCFATISDYRMKSNLRPIDGLSIIMNTKPYKFEYNYDCSTSFGMIAHELQDTLPEAVFGVKDGEVMQGVDYMKLLPITIKALQEQQCQICTQSTIIDQLKTCLGII